MVTETAPVEAKVPFDIAKGRSDLSAMNDRYNVVMTELVEAGKNADITSMARLGSEMSTISVNRDKLEKRIARAESGGGVNSNLATKLAARTKAWGALTEYLTTDASNPLRDMLAVAPGVKQIRIDIASGMFTGTYSTLGGFRTITATGTKRPRASWTGASIDAADGLGSKDVIHLFGAKYGQARDYAKMTASSRQALLTKIVAGESLVNKNAAK